MEIEIVDARDIVENVWYHAWTMNHLREAMKRVGVDEETADKIAAEFQKIEYEDDRDAD